jgi:hypothetical protein
MEPIPIIKAAIEPLALKHGLRVVEESQDRDYSSVLYLNQTTGLRVALDLAELRFFLRLYQLVGGALPLMDGDVSVPGARRMAFDADGLLLLRSPAASPVGKMIPSTVDAEAAARLLGEYARALDQCADDVFSGQFEVFDELDRIVSARARDIRLRRG